MNRIDPWVFYFVALNYGDFDNNIHSILYKTFNAYRKYLKKQNLFHHIRKRYNKYSTTEFNMGQGLFSDWMLPAGNFNKKDILHCEQKFENGDVMPARITYSLVYPTLDVHSPKIISQAWYFMGKQYRFEDDYINVTYDENRKIHSLNDEPAVIEYSYLSTKFWSVKKWYHRGELHRGDGKPAIMYNKEVLFHSPEYYVFGVKQFD